MQLCAEYFIAAANAHCMLPMHIAWCQCTLHGANAHCMMPTPPPTALHHLLAIVQCKLACAAVAPAMLNSCHHLHHMCRLRGAHVCGEWEQLALQCLLALVSASHYAQSFMQSRDQEHNGLLVSHSCHPATLLNPNLNCDAVYATK